MEENIITSTMKMVATNFAKWINKGGWDTCSWDENKWMVQETQVVVNSIDELYEMFLEAERERLKT